MTIWFNLILLVQIASAIAIIVLVLMQHGKGADAGAAFGGGGGSGSASGLFGAAGSANFLSRSTKWAAVVFFVATGALAYIGAQPAMQRDAGGVMDSVPSLDLSVPVSPGSADSAVPSVPDTAGAIESAAPALEAGASEVSPAAAPEGQARP